MRPGRGRWWSLLSPGQQQSVLALIEADACSAAEIFRRLNLQRYCHPATFREFVAIRRRECAARREHVAAMPTGVGLDLEEIEVDLLRNLQAHLLAGTLKPYLLAETRLMMRELERRRTARGKARGREDEGMQS